jgi:hypothetical protein
MSGVSYGPQEKILKCDAFAASGNRLEQVLAAGALAVGTSLLVAQASLAEVGCRVTGV